MSNLRAKAEPLQQAFADSILGFLRMEEAECKQLLLDLSKLIQTQLPDEASDEVQREFENQINDCLMQLYRLRKVVAQKDSMPSLGVQSSGSSVPRLDKARKHFRDKNYREALELFEEHFAIESPKTADLVIMGTSALYAGDVSLADKYANRAIVSSPNDFQALMLKGAIFFGDGAYIRALPYFLKAKNIDPDNPALIRYHRLTEQKLSMESSAPKTAKSRRWKRKRIKGSLVISDYTTMQSIAVPLTSLSAGGALVETVELPDEFNFSLEIPGQNRINGLARKLYSAGTGKFGVRFINLSPEDEDLINAIVS